MDNLKMHQREYPTPWSFESTISTLLITAGATGKLDAGEKALALEYYTQGRAARACAETIADTRGLPFDPSGK